MRRRYLVAYDIRDAQRLRAVHKTMKGFGYALQYSVFVCDLDDQEKIGLRSAIGSVINGSEDSVVLVDLGRSDTRGVECFEFLGRRAHPLPKSGVRIV